MNPDCARHQRRHSVALLTALSLLVLSAASVAAQSGRRAPKTAPVPIPTPSPETTPSRKKAPDGPALSVVVGIDDDAFSNIPLYFNGSVLGSCVDRLRDEPGVKVYVAERSMNRSEAVKRAKAEKESYVALLHLRGDNMAGSSTSLSDVFIEYVVFAPTTGKVVATGHAYQQAYRNRGVVLGPGTSGSSVYTEYRLKEAARDAAERILNALRAAPPLSRPAPGP
jgi:hypothetical protein